MRGAGPAAPGGGPPVVPGPPARLRGAVARLAARLWGEHRLFSIMLVVAAVPRVISMLGFRPALLIQDSFIYLRMSIHPKPNWMRPTGYSYLLFPLRLFHSLDVVTGLQHLAGLTIAVAVYWLLRSRGLPQWGAALAAAPTLFDPRQIFLEQSILSDVAFELLTVVAIVLVLGRRRPALWQATIAGFAVGLATITRGNGFVLIAIVLGCLLLRRVGWRAAGAAALACALPVLGYMTVFYASNGQFALSQGDGLWLWARTMSFANCAVIKPPPNLVPLCPENQPVKPPPPGPAWSWESVVTQPQPGAYLWNQGSWLRSGPDPGLNPQGNALAQQFAIRAIEAQPLDYARVVARDVLLTFLNTDRQLEFSAAPHIAQLSGGGRATLQRYARTSANTRGIGPWDSLMFAYQQPVWFSGLLFALVMLVGLVRIAWRWNWRWRGRGIGGVHDRGPARPALVAWAAAACIIVLPVAVSQYSYRYALPAVPLACLAAALTFQQSRRRSS